MKVIECLLWYVPIIPDWGMRPNGVWERRFPLTLFLLFLVN